MYLNRSSLSKILNYQNNPSELIPKPEQINNSKIEEEEDLSPKEIFISIIEKLNKLSKNGKKKNMTKKSKKKITKELIEFFKDSFPLIDERDEDIFD